MTDYFPIMIDLNKKGLDLSSGGLPQDLVFIDRNGVKLEPELVNAVLNGIEIEVNTIK
jgi:hypothetical protein